jgi:uncharacterized membrane protein YhhN
MRTKSFLPFLPYALASVVNLVANLMGATAVAQAAQYFLMPLLIVAVAAVIRSLRDSVAVALVAALVFSWGGDLLLRVSFPLGLGSFLFAHLAFILAYTRPAIRGTGPWWRPVWAWVYALWFGGLLAALVPHVGALLPAVALYGAALGTMAFLAARTSRLLALGGTLFVASDTILALKLFLPGFHPPFVDFWVMLTYIAAEALLALGLIAAVRQAPSPAPLALKDAEATS